jgi:BatD DUF11 like domain
MGSSAPRSWVSCRAAWLALFVLLWATAPAAAQRGPRVSVAMNVSSTRVAVGEPFAIEVRVDASDEDVDDLEAPDFGGLEVVGRRVSRPFSFSFGFGTGGRHAQVKKEIVYGFTLRALRPGTYKIPPAIALVGKRRVASQGVSVEVVDGLPAQAQPRGLGIPNFPQIPGFPSIPGLTSPGDVDDAPADPGPSAPPSADKLDGARFDPSAFVRTVVDKPSAFIGEQVTVTTYLYVRSALTQSPNIAREPTTDGFWVQDLLPMQRNLSSVRQDVQGRPFQVYVLRRYAAFPMRPGTLEIGAAIVELGGGQSLFDLLNGPQKPLRREGVPVHVEVKPLPAPPAPDPFVGSLELTATLSQPDAKVGDGVTLEIRAAGVGNLRELRLPTPAVPGLDVLAPELRDQLETPLDRVGGVRTLRYLLLPRSAGELVIPAVQVPVFDPDTQRYRWARTQPLTLRVTGAADPSAAPDAPSVTPSSDDLIQFDGPRLTSALRRRSAPLDSAPWYGWTALGLPLLAAVVYAVRGLRTRLPRGPKAPSPSTRARVLLDEARAQTDVRKGLSGVARGLHTAIEVAVGQSLGGFPASALAAKLGDAGVARPTAERISALLVRIDEARFLPVPPPHTELLRAAQEAELLIEALVRHGGKS